MVGLGWLNELGSWIT